MAFKKNLVYITCVCHIRVYEIVRTYERSDNK